MLNKSFDKPVLSKDEGLRTNGKGLIPFVVSLSNHGGINLFSISLDSQALIIMCADLAHGVAARKVHLRFTYAPLYFCKKGYGGSPRRILEPSSGQTTAGPTNQPGFDPRAARAQAISLRRRTAKPTRPRPASIMP